MVSHAILTAEPSLKKLAFEVASLLGTASFLEGIIRVSTVDSVSLFRYNWTKDFEKLTDELVKTMTPDVQRTVRTMAGLKIRETRTPAILFLAKGRLWNPPNETAILLPLPIPVDAFKEIIPHLQCSHQLKELLELLHLPDDTLDETTLQLQSGVDKKKTELPSDSITLVFENVHFEVVPRWVPFLLIRMGTIKEYAE